MLHFPDKISVYVQSTNFETEIKSADFLKRILGARLKFAHFFGGATTLNYALGDWLTGDNTLITDNIAIVSSNTDIETLQKNIVYLFSYVSHCLVTWEQHTISLEYNGQLFIVEPDDTIKVFLDNVPELSPILSTVELVNGQVS